MSKRIRVEYFAMLREQAGCAGDDVETAAANAAELFNELRFKHGFQMTTANLTVAINDHMASWQDAVEDGDSVIFIPPTAGG